MFFVQEVFLLGAKLQVLQYSEQYPSSVFYRDMAPEGSTLEVSNRNLDEITDLALQLQNQTGIKVLWVTCNLFAHPRSVFYSDKLISAS